MPAPQLSAFVAAPAAANINTADASTAAATGPTAAATAKTAAIAAATKGSSTGNSSHSNNSSNSSSSSSTGSSGRHQLRPVKYDYADSFACTYIVSVVAASIAELVTYPLDLTKTRLQIQGEAAHLAAAGVPKANVSKIRPILLLLLPPLRCAPYLCIPIVFVVVVSIACKLQSLPPVQWCQC